MRRPLRLAPMVLGALLAGAPACTTPPIQTPTRSLDRPSDIALVCAVLDGSGAVTMRRLDDCSRDSLEKSQSGGRLFLLVANTNRGEVALAAAGRQWGNDPIGVDGGAGGIIDLDPQNPGFGFIPVGSLPAQVRASADGRLAVTANQGDCDLSVIDVQAAISIPATLGRAANVSCPVVPRNPRTRQPLGARPSWVELAPGWSGETTSPARDGACGAKGYRALVTFPSCQLLAEIDLDTGDVLQAARITRDGVELIADPGTVSCAPECRGGGGVVTMPDLGPGPDDLSVPSEDAGQGGGGDGGVTDGGVTDGGEIDGGQAGEADLGLPPLLPTAQAFPHVLAVASDGDAATIYVGDAVGSAIRTITTDKVSTFLGTGSVPLAGGIGGVSRLRVSPRIPVLGNVRYVYAIGRDNTVRVVEADSGRECETNPDPESLETWVTRQFAPLTLVEDLRKDPSQWQYEGRMRCLPVGDPALPRASLATSPGISLPLASLPRDVVFVHEAVQPTAGSGSLVAPSAAPGVLYGDFAFIISSGGQAHGVTIADLCPQPNFVVNTKVPDQTLSCVPSRFNNNWDGLPDNNTQQKPRAIDVMPNRLRSGAQRFTKPTSDTDPNLGGARLLDVPTVNGAPQTVLTVGDTNPRFCASNAMSLASCGGIDANVPVTWLTQPAVVQFRTDPLAVSENWTFTWEGPLLNRVTGAVGLNDAGGILYDGAAGFCTRGVRPGDKIQLNGCATNDDCGSDQLCYIDVLSPISTRGLCVNKLQSTDTEVSEAIKAGACRPFSLATLRYRVAEAFQDRLIFEEISMPESPIDTRSCQTDDECAKVRVDIKRGSGYDTLPTVCRSNGHGGKVCVVPCTDETNTNAECGDGFVCARSQFDGKGDTARCLRAPVPDARTKQLCLPQLQRFSVRVGDAFIVNGDATGYLHDDRPDPANPVSGRCVAVTPRSEADRLRSGRVPLLFGSAVLPYQQETPRCDKDMVTAAALAKDWFAPGVQDQTGNAACLILPGPTDGCQAGSCKNEEACYGGRCGADAYLRFENLFFRVILDVKRRFDPNEMNATRHYLSSAPVTNSILGFTTIGGARGFAFQLGVDVLAQLPRAAITAPDRTTIYVVDEGKQTTATGLRGQVLRFFSDSQSTDPVFLFR